MNMNRVPAIVAAAVLACAGFVVAQTDQTNPIKWRTYSQGAFSNSQKSFTLTIDNSGAWQNYWRDNFGDPSEAPKDIDFNKEQLVAIHLGTRPTGGYKVSVASIQRAKPGEVRVSYVESLPLPGVTVTQAETTPWVIVRMDKPGAKITFSKSTEDGRFPGGINVIQLGPAGVGGQGGSACGCSNCICGCNGGGNVGGLTGGG